MRNLLVTSAFLALAACGLSEEEFATDFDAAYCEALDTCGAAFTCDDAPTGSTPAADAVDGCEFDADMGQECLDGAPFACDEASFPIIPDACLTAYTCPAPETGAE
ncbi:MAG: hypothetical protein H0V89_02645 [Deltaproteobacteria bacterium]|nr:hypothetical protein [Deltaproteobacteria bacterium]